MSRPTLSRRRFLGSAGTVLALPFLEGLAPWSRVMATSPDTPPTRLLVYFVPNGIRMEKYKPTIPGPDWESTPILEPLETYRDDILILSGLANKAWVADDAPHSHAAGTFLTCQPIQKMAGGQVLGGISADQVAANAIGHLTRFPSLEVSADDDWIGFCEEGYSCGYLQSISWAGPKSPLPTISDPAKLFDRLFAGWNPEATATEIAQRKAEKKSVLDFVLGQAGALRSQLGHNDHLRMDEYMEGIYDLEKAIESYGQMDVDPNLCPDPTAPGMASNHPQRVELLTDLMLLAFRCDQTRIITFMLENGFGARFYDFLGVAQDHHSLTHHFGDPSMITDVVTINTWEVMQFAMLLNKMKGFQEGDGSLLDHTAVLFSSSMSDGNDHFPYNLPVILAGRGGGAISPGRHVIYEDEPARADLYIALMAMLGVEVDTFGEYGTQPLGGLVL